MRTIFRKKTLFLTTDAYGEMNTGTLHHKYTEKPYRKLKIDIIPVILFLLFCSNVPIGTLL